MISYRTFDLHFFCCCSKFFCCYIVSKNVIIWRCWWWLGSISTIHIFLCCCFYCIWPTIQKYIWNVFTIPKWQLDVTFLSFIWIYYFCFNAIITNHQFPHIYSFRISIHLWTFTFAYIFCCMCDCVCLVYLQPIFWRLSIYLV